MKTTILTFLTLSLTLVASAHADYNIATFADTGAISGLDQYNNKTGGFTSGGQFFNNTYHTDYQYATGFSVSSMRDTTTAGYTNQYSAITGGGSGNADADYAILTPTAFVNLSGTVQSVDLTNTTYAYLSMKNGDSFAKKFAAGDYFDVLITGYSGANETGSITGVKKFYLANYASDGDSPVNTWTNVSLTTLGSAQSIGFSFESSDVGKYGINTLEYVAVDNLKTLAAPSVPEPSSLLLCLTGVGIATIARRVRVRVRLDRINRV